MYDIFIVGGFERLITKVKEHDETNLKIYVFLEELYGIICITIIQMLNHSVSAAMTSFFVCFL
jgi:hypothetical protein